MVGLRPVGGNPCLLAADDPRLVRSRDPLRSAARIREAELSGDRELEVRDRVLALLADHGETLADRTTSVGHLTGSALVLDSTAQRTLLMLHTKLDRWLQPGGHADGDHELAGVALKEATEETGIVGLRVRVPAVDIDIHSVDHGDDLGEHLHLDLRFVVVAPDDAVEQGNHESQELRWVTPEELDDLADEPSLVRLARRGFALGAGWTAVSPRRRGWNNSPSD
ncbi:MAG: NUDIX hydrolase [Microthrixaceae bacterium]|nr:NUDIX hydrolase [Microthrixaceae bacterium]